MAYPEKQYTITGQAADFPEYSSVVGTTLLAKNTDGNWGYISASNLQTTLDGAGLATDTDVSASNAARVSLSGSIATKMANTDFAYVTGSTTNGGWNDASASAAGVPVGGLYHTLGTVKVRLS
jgi:hypothetical protein